MKDVKRILNFLEYFSNKNNNEFEKMIERLKNKLM